MLLAVGLSNGDVSTVFDCTLWYCSALFLIILYCSIIYYRVCTILYCLPIYYRVCTMLSFSIVCHTVVHLFWAQCNYGSPCQTLTQLLLYDAFFHTFLWQFSSLFFSCLPIFFISFTSWTIICLHLTSRWVYMTRRGKLTGAHPFNLQPAWWAATQILFGKWEKRKGEDEEGIEEWNGREKRENINYWIEEQLNRNLEIWRKWLGDSARKEIRLLALEKRREVTLKKLASERGNWEAVLIFCIFLFLSLHHFLLLSLTLSITIFSIPHSNYRIAYLPAIFPPFCFTFFLN